MAVWQTMEKRYLPQFYDHGVKTSRMLSCKHGKDDPAREVWALADNPEIPLHERIAMFVTFDDCLVKAEDIPRMVDALREFEGETSLKEQADILEKLARDPEVIAVGWNGTSVNAENWANSGGYDEEAEEVLPYNCLTGDRHYWLFDELREVDRA